MKRLLKLVLVTVVAASLVAVLLTGCAPRAARDPNKNTLVFGIQSDLESLDPQQVFTTFIVHSALFGFPITMGLDGQTPTPFLAETFTLSEDGTKMIMEFPTGLKFSNGRPVTAQAIVDSIERYIEISPYSFDWDDVVEITADGQKLTIRFAQPTAYFFPVIASAFTGIVDVEAAAAVGPEAFGLNPVGVGPFVLQNWVQGSHVELVRNPYFIDNTPFVQNRGPWLFERMIVRIIPDNMTLISELESGNVDVVAGVPAEFVDRLRKSGKVNLYQHPQAGLNFLRFNTDKAPFNDPVLRNAISLAINRDEIKTAFGGHVEPLYGLLSPAQIGFSAEAEAAVREVLAFNVDKAKALLESAGYGPLSMELLIPPAARNAAIVMQAQLREIGITVRITEQAASYVREAVRDRRFDLAIQTWNWSDGDIWFFGLRSGMGRGIVWSSPETDQMLDDQRRLIDMAERQAKFGELSMAIAELTPVLPLYFNIVYTAVRNNITGYQISSTGTIFWNDAYKK